MEGLDTFDIGYAAAKAEYIPELQAKYDAELQNLRDELSATKEKLEAAEKRIRESQEQKPVAYALSEAELLRTDGRCPVLYIGDLPRGEKLYTMPPIPPELAELQRQNAELRKMMDAVNIAKQGDKP